MSKDHTILDAPPSYNEAVFGAPGASNGFQPSSPPVDESYNHQLAPPPALPPAPYVSVRPEPSFPPDLSPLLACQVLTVGSKMGYLSYKIKNMAGLHVFTAKGSIEGDICNCCDPNARWVEFDIRNLNKVPLANFKVVMDEMGCFFFPKMHLDVSYVPDIQIGQVRVRGKLAYDITNNGGDIILTVEGDVGCCEILPYKICTPNGTQVGAIERVDRIKNRIFFPIDMDIRVKVQLLATTVFIQYLDERRRKK
ncbi:uncharacterized protein LOC125035099 [Penaeus chinensis]|uniref:uncharacterized protein LOC125035099 n=1 Tax=Penaeus chinensis TaxID=139456 RepID=UPI001FB6CA51|nr:uncharacterized protein LOC125035099 [Penaeus chinensis]XP_047483207.1 uncharacterized protein LOC125035099 [Penaeus chinensis]XP_047483208.1 uncharacterized protein LOC125035099 [Penaeus chinensis]